MEAEIVTEKNASLISTKELLRETWSLYKEKIKTFLSVLAIPVIVTHILVYIIFNVILWTSILPDSFYQQHTVLAVVLIALCGLIAGLITLFSQVSLLHVLRAKDKKLSLSEIYKSSSNIFIPFIWVTILSGIIIGGGFWFLIIPGIIFTMWFGFTSFIFISENEKGLDAVMKSKAYVNGYTWDVFLRMVGVFFISMIISAIFSLVQKLLPLPFVKEILDIVMALLLTPFVVSYSYLLYENLKSIHPIENWDRANDKRTLFIIIGLIGFLVIQPLFFYFMLNSLA